MLKRFRRDWLRAAVMVCGAGFAGVGSATAQNTVIPSVATSTAGTSSNTIPLGNFASGTYQVMYGEALMANLPRGSVITGIQLRLRNTATQAFPQSGMVIPKFDVTLAGSSRTPDTMSTTYAANMVNSVLARSGPLNVVAGAYPGGAATGTNPEAWGPVIAFTNPYVYSGGPLVMEFRTENGTLASGPSADAFVTPGMSFMSSGSSTSTSAPSTNPGDGLIVRLTYITQIAQFQTGITRLLIQDDLANIRGASANSYPLDASARTIQLIADAGEMRRLGLGSRFVGLHYRNASSAWPAGNQSFSKYDIQLSRALNTPATMSDTIATNTGPDATLVRSGPLAIAGGSFAGLGASPRPAPWTLEFPFTNPYTYTGGPLLTVVRHDGVTGLGAVVAGTLSTDPTYGTRVKARAGDASSSLLATTTAALSYTAQLWSVDSGTVAPNTNTTVRGNATLGTPLSNTERTSQFIISGSELTYLPVGCQITGLTFRGFGNANRPTVSCAFADYQIFASSAARRPQTASVTFAENDGPDVVQVRSGGLFVTPDSLPGGAVVNPFGQTIQFERAFVYQGGDLCITIRHSGSGSEAISIDGSTNTALTRTISATTKISASGSLAGGGPIVRFEYNPSVVAPAALDNTAGTIGYSVFHQSTGNVLQSVYSEAELRGLRIGSLITGMSLRTVNFGGYSDWPNANTDVVRFDVTLSKSPVAPQSMSDTFALNVGSDAILVRSGPMTIPAKAFPFLSSPTRPSEYRWFIQFTEPYVYKGGPLNVTIRNDSGAGGTFFYADAFNGPSTVAAGRWANGIGVDATVSNSVNKGALAIRFAFVPRSFCPADLNNDGVVDDGDFPLFLSGYNTLDCADGSMVQGCPADINYDRVVDDLDFVVFLAAYNELVCP